MRPFIDDVISNLVCPMIIFSVNQSESFIHIFCVIYQVVSYSASFQFIYICIFHASMFLSRESAICCHIHVDTDPGTEREKCSAVPSKNLNLNFQSQ